MNSVLPSVPPKPASAKHCARVPQSELITSRSGVASVQSATVVPAAKPLSTPAAPEGPKISCPFGPMPMTVKSATPVTSTGSTLVGP